MDAISFAKDGVTHGGTYTANMVALSAAKATLTVLKETDALETIAIVGQKIQALLSRVFTKFDIEHCFAGPDAMFGVHFGSEVPQNYRDWKKTNSDLYTQFALNLIDNGVMLEPDSREPWFICEAHQTVDLKWLEQVAEQSMSAAINAQ
jgi:glutamate-1-semialdehyde 2,1-aminomutase